MKGFTKNPLKVPGMRFRPCLCGSKKATARCCGRLDWLKIYVVRTLKETFTSILAGDKTAEARMQRILQFEQKNPLVINSAADISLYELDRPTRDECRICLMPAEIAETLYKCKDCDGNYLVCEWCIDAHEKSHKDAE